jgi:hypothetical protein
MKLLRPLSARPELIPAIREPNTNATFVGVAGPLGRNRLVSCLPPNRNTGPVQLKAPLVLRDHLSCVLADPDGNLIGERGLWVTHMVSAAKTLDTRRL